MSLLTWPRCLTRDPGGSDRKAGGGFPILTLHPVPTHWAQEVGVEAEGLVDLPEDLSDVPDLPRNGQEVHPHFLEGAGSAQRPLLKEGACSDPERKPLSRGRRESCVTTAGRSLEVARPPRPGPTCEARQDTATGEPGHCLCTDPSTRGPARPPTLPSLYPFLTVHCFGGWAFSGGEGGWFL